MDRETHFGAEQQQMNSLRSPSKTSTTSFIAVFIGYMREHFGTFAGEHPYVHCFALLCFGFGFLFILLFFNWLGVEIMLQRLSTLQRYLITRTICAIIPRLHSSTFIPHYPLQVSFKTSNFFHSHLGYHVC